VRTRQAGDDECVPVCNGGKVKLDAVKAGDDECVPVCNGGKVKLDAVQAGDESIWLLVHQLFDDVVDILLT